MNVLLIRSDLILFPGITVNVFPSSKMFDEISENDASALGIVPRNGDAPFDYGCLATVTKKKDLIVLFGTNRFRILDQEKDSIQIINDEVDQNDVEIMGLSSLFKSQVQVFAKMLQQIAPRIASEILYLVDTKPPVMILFLFAFIMDMPRDEKLKILSSIDLKYSFELGLKWIDGAIKDFKVSLVKIKSKMEKNPDLKRLSRLNPNNADYHVIYSYLECVADLPWETAVETVDVAAAERILNEDHYGLEKAPILCLVGPPGTGKTSLGKSIARALNRKFYRIALGGVRDEAQIRGHRRTYIGALPGLIIQSFRKIGINNPVFLLDEIDKLGTDGRSDPTAALLEVLDPEQNQSFTDSYLNLPFDISKTVFIATANELNHIPEPLKDRMEIINIPSYTFLEKASIAKTHLISKQIRLHGLNPQCQQHFSDDLIHYIIENYTREAGVRDLERQIAAICRFIAIESTLSTQNLEFTNELTKEVIEKILGLPVYQNLKRTDTETIGLAAGLAWTSVGGKVLFIESTSMKGSGKLLLTGTLGETMKEFVQIALSWIKSNQNLFPSAMIFPFQQVDFHLHIPSGGIPKDGPSAGITILISLLSHILQKPILKGLAMTGEITLLGEVLSVGGIRDKALAAKSMKLSRLILPKGNQKDFELLDMGDLKVDYVDNITSAIAIAFGFNDPIKNASSNLYQNTEIRSKL